VGKRSSFSRVSSNRHRVMWFSALMLMEGSSLKE